MTFKTLMTQLNLNFQLEAIVPELITIIKPAIYLSFLNCWNA